MKSGLDLGMSDIYNWSPMVALKDRETFSLKITNIAPAIKCATFVDCTKNCFMYPDWCGSVD